ncbi:MAG: hypothetical protein FJ290_30100 [Planctomycetes bacterium]|nr:hypothetical protein [Planctomycetota bacterium]
MADGLVKQGRHAEALTFYLHALDCGGDRTFPKAVPPSQPENKAYLDQITSSPPESLITKALAGFAACCEALIGSQGVSKGWTPELAGKWGQAFADTYTRHGDWAGAWAKIALSLGPTPHGGLTRLCLAQCLRREGYFAQAKHHLEGVIADGRIAPLAERAQIELALLLGESYGLYPRAEALLAEVQDATDHFVAARARLHMGQIQELQGHLDRAGRTYGSLANDEVNKDVKARAAHALRRLREAREKYAFEPLGARKPGLYYLGEDRQSKGDWKNRCGVDAFILCSICAPGNSTGGNLWPIGHRDGFGNEAELTGSCHWLSGGYDRDPSALFCPSTSTRRFANWDDGGEKHPIGEGPHLCWDLDVPAGLLRLSLYFVNDCNFYEPSRKWTLHVYDKPSARYLAGCAVEDFVNGVYKQFIVLGPRQLRFQLWRDLSLNALLNGIFLDKITVARLEEEPQGTDGHASLYQRAAKRYEELRRLSETDTPQYAVRFQEYRAMDEMSRAPHAPWLTWQTAWLLRNEPDRARDAAQEFFRRLAGASGTGSILERINDDERKCLDERRYPEGRTYTLSKLCLLQAQGPLPWDALCRQAMEPYMSPVEYPEGLAFVFTPSGHQSRKPVSGQYPRDFAFAHRLVWDRLVPDRKQFPEQPRPEAVAFAQKTAAEHEGPGWRQIFGEITASLRSLWPDYRPPLHLMTRYAEAGLGTERRLRWREVLAFYDQPTPEASGLWVSYLTACRRDQALPEALEAEKTILTRFQDSKLHVKAKTEIAMLYCKMGDWTSAQQRLEALVRDHPEAAGDLNVRVCLESAARGQTGIEVLDVRIDPPELPSDGASTAQCSVTVWRWIKGRRHEWRTGQPTQNNPAARKLVWAVSSEESFGATVDPNTGRVTAGKKAGTIWLRAADGEHSRIFSCCQLVLRKP